MTTTLLLPDALALGAGAFLGAVSRHQAGRLAAEWIALDPTHNRRYRGWHTAAINVSGSFVLGLVSAAPLKQGTTLEAASSFASASPQAAEGLFVLTQRMKLLWGVGFCGSFTTFSTYSVDVATWVARGESTKALSYMAANNLGGFVAAGLGIALMNKLMA